MVSINNTAFNRLTSTSQVDPREQTRLMSNRHVGSLEQTTSSQTGGSSGPAVPSPTYANPAQNTGPNHSAVSSTSSAHGATNPPSRNPVNDFESMDVIKALLARYRDADGSATPYRPDAGELLDISVKTKDGDTVTLSISADFLESAEDGAVSFERETSFSFVVAGELSDKEREAVDA